jgi:PhnB protein
MAAKQGPRKKGAAAVTPAPTKPTSQQGPAPKPMNPAKPASPRRVQAIPPGHPRVSPYIIAPDAARVIEFLKRVLDAQVLYRLDGPDGKVMHSEVKVVDSVLMISEACDGFPATQAMLHVYVEDCDEVFAKAIAAGAQQVRPIADQFYGDRSGGVKDHAGNQWWFSTHIEDVSPEEIGRRAAAMKK